MIRNIDLDLCIRGQKCGFMCEAVCPTDVIRIPRDSGVPVVAYHKDCITCFACEVDCPVDAVDVSPIIRMKPQPW